MNGPRRAQRFSVTLSSLLLCILIFPTGLGAQTAADPVMRALQGIESSAGGPVEMRRSPVTGLATFVATKAGRPITVTGPSLTHPEDRALAFIDSHGKIGRASCRERV